MKKIISVIILGLLAGCSIPSNSRINQHKIGVIAPMSGPAAAFGTELVSILQYEASKLATDNLQIEFVIEDGKCNGVDATTAFYKLADVEQVDAIIGGVCSPESLAIGPLTEQYKLLAVSATSGSEQIEGLSSHLYSLVYGSQLTVNGINKQIQGSQKIAIISEQSDINIDIHNGLVQTNSDKQLVLNEYPSTQSDFRNMISTVIKEQPEVLILNPKAGDNAKKLILQLAEFEQDLKDIKLISHVPYLSDDSRANVQSLTEGMIIVATPEVDDSKIQAMKSGTKVEFQALNNFMVATTADALNNLARALKASQINKTDVQSEFTQMNLKGLVVEGINFKNTNMLNSYKSGLYKVTAGQAISTN